MVYATASDLAKLPYDGLAEVGRREIEQHVRLTQGFYVVGSGNTGVTASLALIGG